MMKPKNVARLLIAFGVVLILYSQVMDVSVGSFRGERIVNIHLLSKQQNYLWLGGISLLAGILLFGMHHMKQSKEDERQEKESEEAAVREAVAKASEGASKSIAAFGSAVDSAVTVSSDVVQQVADFELVSRLFVGAFVGATFGIILFVVAETNEYPSWPALIVSAATLIYALIAGSAWRVKSQLLTTNIAVLSLMLVLVVIVSRSEDPAAFDVGTVLVTVVSALAVSVVWLFRVRKRA